MSESYKAAHELEVVNRGAISSYPLLNWISAELCLNPERLHEPLRTNANDLLARVQQAAAAVVDPDFWTFVTSADVLLTQSLIEGRVDESRRDELLQAYRKVVARAGSPKQLRSIIEHLDFLADIYQAWDAAAVKRIGAIIREAANQLRDGSAEPGASAPAAASIPRKRGGKRSAKAASKAGRRTP